MPLALIVAGGESPSATGGTAPREDGRWSLHEIENVNAHGHRSAPPRLPALADPSRGKESPAGNWGSG